MTVIGLYHAGSSVLHRIPAGWKFLGMVLAIIGIVLLTKPWQLAVAALVLAGYAVVGAVATLLGSGRRGVVEELEPVDVPAAA